jgi:basic membrane protein A and related proteins
MKRSYKIAIMGHRSFLALGAFIVLAGCAPSGDTSKAADASPSPSTGSGKTLKVALLTPGPVSDAGWNALANTGLDQIKSQLGAETNQQEAAGSKIKDAMRSYAQQGYDLVIGHGYEYNEPEVAVAADFPKTTFVSSSGGKTAPNAGAFRFNLEQGFYLAGMMAATMSKSHHLAMIGGDEVPSIKSTFKAFEAGAKAVVPTTVVDTVFTGNGQDIAKAKEATLTEIGKGVDMVIHQANAAAQGVFDACKEKNIYAFGANLDQNDNSSGMVLASAVIVPGPAFVDLAKKVQAGTYKGSVTPMGMDIGAIDFIVNPKLKDKVPADLMKKIDDSKELIKAGKLAVPMDKF